MIHTLLSHIQGIVKRGDLCTYDNLTIRLAGSQTQLELNIKMKKSDINTGSGKKTSRIFRRLYLKLFVDKMVFRV